jgi:hypothetical protein
MIKGETYYTVPVEVCAIQWTDYNPSEVKEFLGNRFVGFEGSDILATGNYATLHRFSIPKGTWIVKLPDGDLKTYRDKEFHKKFIPSGLEVKIKTGEEGVEIEVEDPLQAELDADLAKGNVIP